MTHSQALHSFADTMTDDEMRALWQRLEAEGCKIIRYNPTDNKNMWRMRITNPAWNGLHEADSAIDVSYTQRKNDSWVMVV